MAVLQAPESDRNPLHSEKHPACVDGSGRVSIQAEAGCEEVAMSVGDQMGWQALTHVQSTEACCTSSCRSEVTEVLLVNMRSSLQSTDEYGLLSDNVSFPEVPQIAGSLLAKRHPLKNHWPQAWPSQS